MLSRIRRSIRHHFKCFVDTLIIHGGIESLFSKLLMCAFDISGQLLQLIVEYGKDCVTSHKHTSSQEIFPYIMMGTIKGDGLSLFVNEVIPDPPTTVQYREHGQHHRHGRRGDRRSHHHNNTYAGQVGGKMATGTYSGQSGKRNSGSFTGVTAYPDSTNPGQGQMSYPDQGQMSYPGQGQMSYPGQGHTTNPGQGQMSYPGQGHTTNPGQGQRLGGSHSSSDGHTGGSSGIPTKLAPSYGAQGQGHRSGDGQSSQRSNNSEGVANALNWEEKPSEKPMFNNQKKQPSAPLVPVEYPKKP